MTTTSSPVAEQGLEELRCLLEKSTLPGQREAIAAGEQLVVVSAGAGTGKTWTLAWRYVWSIATGKASVPEILTLTFTEKAALEMKERIRSLLVDVARKIPSLSDPLNRAAERMDESFVSTLHSFSLRVIREGGLTLDMDPESRPAGTPEVEEFWRDMEDRLDRMDGTWFTRRTPEEWRERQAGLFGGTPLIQLLNSYGTENIIGLSRGIGALWASRGQKPEELWDFSCNLANEDTRALLRLSRIYSPFMEEEWHRWCGPEGIIRNVTEIREKKTKLSERLIALQEKWGAEKPSGEQVPQYFRDLMVAVKGASGKLKERLSEELGRSVSEYRSSNLEYLQLCDILEKGLDPADQATRTSLLQLSALMWQMWEVYKRRKSLLSFDDMISRAVEALLSGSMRGRFREVLVDEFQDTNRLQDQLLKAVSDGGNTSMFLVGDLKQSIYRFRHAEPSLFLEYIRKATDGQGRYINLDVSFRSSALVLTEINTIFGEIWKRGLGKELLHPYEPLRSPVDMPWHHQRQGTCSPALEIMTEYFSADDSHTPAESQRLYLARRLGRRLCEMKKEGRLVWDKSGEELRPAQWRDMAVLVPTRSQYRALEKVFTEELSIPCYFESNMGYYSRSEVQDLLSLIDHLAVPSNMTALVSFLSSPFSGLSLSEVSLLLEETGQEGPLADLPLKLKEKYPCISRNIEHWRRIATLEGISKVFSMILANGEVLLAFPVWKRKKAAANLRKAIDIAREYEQTLGTDMRGCAAYLRGSMGRGIAMEDASSTGEKDDVVRIMTVHASKGLEFPILAIMGMEHTPKDRTPGTSLSPSGLLGCSISRYPEDVVPTTSDDPPSAFLSRLLDRQEQQEEWQRLFYVAATRARDALILCGTLKCKEGAEPVPPEGSWLSMIWDNDEIKIPLLQDHMEKDRESSGKGSSIPIRGRSVDIPSRDGTHLSRLSATSYSLFRFCPFAWRMRHRQGRDLKWELPGGDGYGGADLGSLAHWILRKWDFREDSLDELLPSETDLQTKAGSGIPSFLLPLWEREKERTTLRKWLLQLAGSSAGLELRSLLERGILSREIPFRVKLDQGPILTGTMDLMWQDGDTVNIRDYKITAMEKAPEELYTDQLRFYGLAALQALEDRELQLDMRLIHLREGIQTEKISLPKDGLESVKKDILSAACKAAQGPFEPQTEKCSTCPFRKDCTFHIA